ncbi:MAG: hypothetical protein M1308_24370 [Actinobacteria bacterium]|nr:hypothetical protein [Actinomycetota bacterium]
MALKKATLLFDEEVYEKLREKSVTSNTSIGELVREAVASYYGIRNSSEKIEALNKLKNLDLPVGSPEEIEAQIIRGRNLKEKE